MPIHLDTHHAPATLLYHFAGRITREDLDTLQAAEDACFSALDAGHPVCVIADMSQVDTIATQLLTAVQRMRFLNDARVDRVLVVGANPYLRAMAISLGGLAGKRPFAFYSSMDTALHALDAAPAQAGN